METLWLEFKEVLNAGIRKFIPTKFVDQKKHLPWITQPIRREIRKRERLYKKKLKRSKAPKDRKAFLDSKHGVKTKIKMAYDKYLEDILGLNDDTGNQPFCRKKLFGFLSSRADAQGIAVLKKGDAAFTDNVDQANLLNSKFQSVFSIRSPLSLAKLCHSTLLNGTASLLNLLPESVNCKYPSMPDIDISTSGIAKFLSNLNVSKAAGPDSLRPVGLKELGQVIAPTISIIFQVLLDSGTVPSDWKKAQVCPLFKQVAQWATIAHLRASIIYDAQRQVTLNLKQ